MKIFMLHIISVLFLFCSCDKNDESNTCGHNPLENIVWLKELVDNENSTDDTSGLEIIQYTYIGNTVFSINDCVNNCSDAMTIVYDCDKNVLCEFGGVAGLNTCPDFEIEALDKKVLFSNASNSISKVTFENSFGMCSGYCINNIQMWDQKLLFQSKAWGVDLPTKVCSNHLPNDQWITIRDGVDVNTFFNLKDVYGCPDCADGGASLIAIELLNGESKNVTFEYNNPPEEIEVYASMLQKILDESSSCDDKINNELCDKAVIISKDLYDSSEASPIENISIEGNCMHITYSLLSTQDPLMDVMLIDSGAILESYPVQRNLKFVVAESLTKPTIVSATTSFDISALAPWDDPKVILNIEGYTEQITYVRSLKCGDRNVSCIPTTQEIEAKYLAYMLDEIKAIAASVECENPEDWKIAAIGSKACGGPQSYLAYANTINETIFLAKVEAYKIAEENYNKSWGIVSTCDVPAMPSSVVCEGEKPKFIYDN